MANGGRDTGLQVVHYLSALVTRNTKDIATGVLVGRLPPGAIPISARVLTSTGWGGGRSLILSLGAPSPLDIATLNVGPAGVVDNPVAGVLSALLTPRDLMVRLSSAPGPNGAALVIFLYLPSLG